MSPRGETGARPFDVVERLIAEHPTFHPADTDASWIALPNTLRLLARHARPGNNTLETGCGASTVVFAAAGSVHTAISPVPEEHARVREYCERAGIDHGSLTFIEGYSDEVLPALELPEPLDVAFIDADHSFPYPVIDWHYINRLLRVGGVLLADDLTAPAAAIISRNMLVNPNWELLEVADLRAAAFRKLGHKLTFDHWRDDPFNEGFPDYSFLGRGGPLRQRLRDRAREAKQGAMRRSPALARLFARRRRNA